MTRAQRFAALRAVIKQAREDRDAAALRGDVDVYEIAARRVTELRSRLRRGEL